MLKNITNLNNKSKVYNALFQKVDESDKLSIFTGRKTSYKDYESLAEVRPMIKRYRSLLTAAQDVNFFTFQRYIYYHSLFENELENASMLTLLCNYVTLV